MKRWALSEVDESGKSVGYILGDDVRVELGEQAEARATALLNVARELSVYKCYDKLGKALDALRAVMPEFEKE